MQSTLDLLFSRLRRFPDVEAANLQAWDATDRLLLDTAAELRASGVIAPGARVAVVGDRYGALTLGLLALGRENGTQEDTVRVHQDLITGERALRQNAAAVGVTDRFDQLPLAPRWRAPGWCCSSCRGPSLNSRRSPTPSPGTLRPVWWCWPAAGSST